MRSFAFGSVYVEAETINSAIAICCEINRLKSLKETREKLRAINHGHVFGWNRECHCGISDTEYFNTLNDEKQPCKSPTKEC